MSNETSSSPEIDAAPATTVNLNNCATWPKSVRQALDNTAAFIKMAYIVGRQRALDADIDTLTLMVERDKLAHELGRARADLDAFRRRLRNIGSNKRPPFTEDDRFFILQEIRLRQWSLKKAANHYVVHHNTLGLWRHDFLHKNNVGGFFGRPVANKISDIVRFLVHQLAELFPEPEIGTRTIANEIKKAGIELSRSSVQRILREKKPKQPAAQQKQKAPEENVDYKPRHILAPKEKNRTWHLDLTVINLIVVKFFVAALIDGFSRKLLTLRVYADCPKAQTMIDLVREAIGVHGRPRFLVTDHGSQFRKQFKKALESKVAPKLTVVRGKRGDPRFNGKVERFFRTLKLYQCLAFIPLKIEQVQARLESFRHWYNEVRCHQGIDGRRPEEVWKGSEPHKRRRVLARDRIQPDIEVRRENFDNDRYLPKVVIELNWPVERQEAS